MKNQRSFGPPRGTKLQSEKNAIERFFHSFRPCRSSERRREEKVFVAAPAEAHFSDGARRSIRLMRLQLKISIPTVQGMQYPQPRQNAPPRDRMAFPTLYTYSPAVSIRKLRGCAC